jgi:hypothetical protein
MRSLGLAPERIHVTPLGVSAPSTEPASEWSVRSETEPWRRPNHAPHRTKHPKEPGPSGALSPRAGRGCRVHPASTPHEAELRALAKAEGGRAVRFPRLALRGAARGPARWASLFVLPIAGRGARAAGGARRSLRGCLWRARIHPRWPRSPATRRDVRSRGARRRLTAAIRRLLDNRGLARDELIQRGFERARAFTWRRTGNQPGGLPPGDRRRAGAPRGYRRR